MGETKQHAQKLVFHVVSYKHIKLHAKRFIWENEMTLLQKRFFSVLQHFKHQNAKTQENHTLLEYKTLLKMCLLSVFEFLTYQKDTAYPNTLNGERK